MTANTRDHPELAHFQAWSSSWWDEQGPYKILHAITPLRMAFIKEKIGLHFKHPEKAIRPLKGLRILDVGCGGGLLCEPLARLGAEVTGIDPLEETIHGARAHAQAMGLKITYLPCSIEEINLPLFDVIIASEIIEHVANPDHFLTACAERLSPNGGMVITTFNKTLKSYVFGILVAEYLLKWAPKGTHTWDKFITPQYLSQNLLALGFSSFDVKGLSFSPLTGEWSLSSKTDINYFLWAGRP